MKNKPFIFSCFCALLLIAIVAIEPSQDEKQVGNIEKSKRNIGQESRGVYTKGIGIPFTGSGGDSANNLLFLNCEKHGDGENGCGGDGDCDGEEGGAVKGGDKEKEVCNGKPPVRQYPDIGMGYGC